MGGFEPGQSLIARGGTPKGRHDNACGTCGGVMRREWQVEVVEEELHVTTGFGAAHEQKFAAVGGRHDDVEHLHGREFFENHARYQTAGHGAELLAQGDREARGEERDEQVRLNPFGQLMKNRPQAEVALERAERFLDKTQLHRAAPNQLPIGDAELGAQRIAAFAPAHGAQFVTIQPIREGTVGGDLDLHQAGRATAGLFLRGAEFLEQRVAGRALLLEFAAALPVGLEPTAVHPAFFAGAGLALGAHGEFAVLRVEFDAHMRTHRLPRPLGERRFVAGEAGLGVPTR